MILESILRIIQLSLELRLEFVRGMTDAQRAAEYARYEKWMDFWEGLLARFIKKEDAAEKALLRAQPRRRRAA